MTHILSKFLGCFTLVVFLLGQVVAFDIPINDGWVTDQASLYTEQEEQLLENQLQELEQATTAEVAVLTLDSLQGYDIAEVAVLIANQGDELEDNVYGRGIGKAGVDNGILVIIAPNEKKRRIEVGLGLEEFIPDATAYRLGEQDLVPAFRAEQWYGGTQQLITHLRGLVEGTYSLQDVEEYYAGSRTFEDYVVGLIMICFLSLFLASLTKTMVKKKKEKKRASWIGSVFSTLFALIPFGLIGFIYFLPVYGIWRWIMFSKFEGGSGGGYTPASRSSGTRSSSGSFGGGFSGFGGGSFGGGGASGGR